jgi:A/G-specific adenine glycosylase
MRHLDPDKKLQPSDQNFPLESILDWFTNNKRDFPWRKSPSFYEVLVSEFMLQQTVAATVIPFYSRWMQKFPSLLHLANSSAEEVIKAWEGLGYYSRARRLHAIATIQLGL